MKKYITEFTGTFFYVFFVWMTLATGFVTGAGSMTRISIGLGLAVLIYAGAKISGAHYNPAITLAAHIQRRIGLKDTIVYMIFQTLGALSAAFLVMFLLEAEQLPKSPIPIKNGLKAMVAEFMAVFLLAFVYLRVMQRDLKNSYYGFVIGITVSCLAYAVGTISGGVFNPMVFIAAAVLKWAVWGDYWIYIVGCFSGAILAAGVYNLSINESANNA